MAGAAGDREGGAYAAVFSRMPFVRAYPRETQEMVFDAHDAGLRLLRRGPAGAASTTT